MSSETLESYSERQENELQILESIYGDVLEDLRLHDAWKVPRPPEFTLELQPQESMGEKKEKNVKITMQVKFSDTYPDSLPEITFVNANGISAEAVSLLSKETKRIAESLIGEVMMFQIAQFVQEYLHNHKVPQYSSIYEEMLQNKQKIKEKNAREEEKKKDLERRKEVLLRQKIEEERARRKEEEKKLRRQQREERDAFASTENARRVSESSSHSMDNINRHPGVTEIKFAGKHPRVISMGQSLGVTFPESEFFIGMDNTTGEIVAIRYMCLPSPAHNALLTNVERNKLDKSLKAVNTIEQEINSLSKLSHKNILLYLAMRNQHCDSNIEVHILQEYCHGISLDQKISSGERIELDTLRAYAEQILLGLEYLHLKSVVHKQFQANSVFLNSQGVIKITNYSIGKRLADLFQETSAEAHGVRFSEDRIPAKLSKKGDILHFGMVVLSLALGQSVSDYPPDIPAGFPPVFVDFLDKCLVVEDRCRLGATDLLKHEFFKNSIGKTITAQYSEHHGVDQNGVEAPDWERADEEQLYPSHSSPEGGNNPVQLSRLHSEFEELEWLGKGGYGDVVKVRNVLDDRHYAIKRIHLNPHRSLFNRKITREVKLLSRLNHENVVRYYNSWIETVQCKRDELSNSSSSTFAESQKVRELSKNSLGFSDNIEKMAPPPVHSAGSEWSISMEEVSRAHGFGDEDDDQDNIFNNIYIGNKDSSSESVLFDHDDDTDGASSSSGREEEMKFHSTTNTDSNTTESSSPIIVQRFLYIQMEYCEKSTLRQTIDAGLCRETDRMWRLFREILEGLVHVHEQGMIHRDLKPQNIFLDKNDHVKIGDFGLATAHSRPQLNETLDDSSSAKSDLGESTTGVVGTALYVAPELLTKANRTTYSQKVDIYSLGIIFFEMSYAGIVTKMERASVLSNLRLPSITFPEDFDEAKNERESNITRLCLDHDPTQRPSAAELLRSRWVPTVVLQEGQVLDAVNEMLSDPRSKAHKLVIDAVFGQTENPTASAIYDTDMYIKRPFSSTTALVQQQTHDKVASILRRHGAVLVNTPLLMSRQGCEGDDTDVANFLDRGGTVVTLPHNLRVPFARYVTSGGHVPVKRYVINRVFRARNVRGSKPKEMWECSFDLVTLAPSGLVPDAEVICAVAEIISNFPGLASRKYEIRINHMEALVAVLGHCGVGVDHHQQALDSLASCDRLSKSQTKTCLSSLPINQQQLSTLNAMVFTRGSLPQLQNLLKPLTRKRQSSFSQTARKALQEFELLQKHLSALQLDLPACFDLGFVPKHHRHYNGIVFQVSAEIQKKKRAAIEILALGGRYDKLLASLSHLRMGDYNKGQTIYAVGVSIAIEKVVESVLQSVNASSAGQGQCDLIADHCHNPHARHRHPTVDVLVCAIGRSQLLHERLKIVKGLWEAGIAAETPYERSPHSSVQDMQEMAQDRGIAHLVYITEKESGKATVKSLFNSANGKASERKVPLETLLEHLNKSIRDGEDATFGMGQQKTPASLSSSSASDSQPQSANIPTPGGTRQLSVDLISPEKLAYNVRKRHEFEIRTKLSSLALLSHISSKTHVCAIAVDLPSQVLKQMPAALDLRNSEEDFNSSAVIFAQSVPRHRKYISTIAERICEAVFAEGIPFVILYSYKDNGYFFLL